MPVDVRMCERPLMPGVLSTFRHAGNHELPRLRQTEPCPVRTVHGPVGHRPAGTSVGAARLEGDRPEHAEDTEGNPAHPLLTVARLPCQHQLRQADGEGGGGVPGTTVLAATVGRRSMPVVVCTSVSLLVCFVVGLKMWGTGACIHGDIRMEHRHLLRDAHGVQAPAYMEIYIWSTGTC